MPGRLFFYLNCYHIKLNKDINSKQKIISRPFFRLIEWDKAYVMEEARGFSGFKDDEEVSCHRRLKQYYDKADSLDPDIIEAREDDRRALPSGCYKADGSLKKYENARDYVRKQFPRSLGKPLYQNEALNVIDIEARETGKSYWASSCITHNFLFDGATDFDEYLEGKHLGEPLVTDTLVGAVDFKYTDDLLNKVAIGLEYLPGVFVDAAGRRYPSPLSRATTGSMARGSKLKAGFEKKMNGAWVKEGQGSILHHVSFADNDLAGAGTRFSLGFLEEVGFMGNIKGVLGGLRDSTTTSGRKMGTIYMMGTGGDMEGGTTQFVQDVFNDPVGWDCVAFDDEWEHSNHKIGYFCPQYRADNEFLDKSTGMIDEEASKRKSLRRRAELAQSKDKGPLNKELENKPLVPSEAFLVTSSNMFPIADLKRQLDYLNSLDKDPGDQGEFIIGLDGKVKFVPDLEPSKLSRAGFPVKKGDHQPGCVVIFEHPDPAPMHGYYVAGCDPYNKDEAEHSVSLGSIFILKRAKLGGYDKIVAEYTGRPERADIFYETCRRLLHYYNGFCLYENNFNGLKTYFQQKHDLSRLAFTPNKIKASSSKSDNAQNVYGLHMHGFVKDELEIYLRDWLTTKVEGGEEERMHLHFIYSKPLLAELIAYDSKNGNYDRAIALMLAIAQRIQMHNVVVQDAQEKVRDPFFNRPLFRARQ